MTIRKIEKSVDLGLGYRLDITKSNDSFNGLVYEGEGTKNLIACNCVGLHEGMNTLIKKVTAKLITTSEYIKKQKQFINKHN